MQQVTAAEQRRCVAVMAATRPCRWQRGDRWRWLPSPRVLPHCHAYGTARQSMVTVEEVKAMQQSVAALVQGRRWVEALEAAKECRQAIESLTGCGCLAQVFNIL